MPKITTIRSLAYTAMLAMLLATNAVTPVTGADVPARALRVGMPLIPDTLDPARADNMQAMYLMAGIYDTLFVLDPVARPAVIVPMAAATLPEISADYRTFTIRVRPGIFFTPHPSFGGKPRELTAADFAYAFKRIVDPKIRSPGLYFVEGKIEGLDALAKRAQDAGTGLDYDAPVPGLLVVDRHTLRIRLNAPEPIFPFLLTSAVFAGLAREVVEAEGETYGQRPVGTGAFAVAAYVPGQRLELARNRSVRSLRWEDLLTSASRAVQPTAVEPNNSTLSGLRHRRYLRNCAHCGCDIKSCHQASTASYQVTAIRTCTISRPRTRSSIASVTGAGRTTIGAIPMARR